MYSTHMAHDPNAEGPHSTTDDQMSHIPIRDRSGRIIGWKSIRAPLLLTLIATGTLLALKALE